jgi:hypothetical protein
MNISTQIILSWQSRWSANAPVKNELLHLYMTEFSWTWIRNWNGHEVLILVFSVCILATACLYVMKCSMLHMFCVCRKICTCVRWLFLFITILKWQLLVMGIFQQAISHHRNAGTFTSENKYIWSIIAWWAVMSYRFTKQTCVMAINYKDQEVARLFLRVYCLLSQCFTRKSYYLCECFLSRTSNAIYRK